ncbi:glycosyltransferase family 4 protein [Actinopolymorpha sp. B11F2]|uniref:glycosyltransferase family 4 protein n=1 Tax=Actinopolymorpha sp. B11F2 TaxID=3160862 RepID=UPI0032E3F366
MTDILVIGSPSSSADGLARIAGDFTSSGCTVRVALAVTPRHAIPNDVREALRVAEIRQLRTSLTGRRAGVAPRRGSAAWARVVLRNAVVRAGVRIGGPSRRAWLLAKYDPWLRRSAVNADVILAADRHALRAARHAGTHGTNAVVTAVGDRTYAELRDRAIGVRPLQRLLHTRSADQPPQAAVLAAWRKVATDPGHLCHRPFVAKAVEITKALRRHEALDATEEVGRSALDLPLSALDRDRIRLELVMVRISRGDLPDELDETARAMVRHADEHLRAGRTRLAAAFALDVADAMFSRELHADALSTPLVEAPEEFLAPLHESLTFRALAARSGALADADGPGAADARFSGGPSPRPPLGRTTGRRPHRILVVPGDYPHFTQGIISTLASYDDADLRVLSLREPGVNRRKKRLTMVTDRLNDARGEPPPPLEQRDAELLAWPDTIFVDWCDNAAQWVALHAPSHVRLVVRLHSLEAISPQPHLIDWSRVSDVVFVAQHVRHLVERAVPGVAASGRIHVIPNEMRLRRFGLPKRPGAERTVAMVGWAQQVKDPLWALEVLAQLRGHDPSWRLRLIGHDFSDRQHRGALRYRDRFRARAEDGDVRDALDRVPYTDDLPEALRDAGFILSASRREGFPVGTTEGAASAAVPVIRDWPMYASAGGARGIYPAEWVVETPDEAATRILAYADHGARDRAGQAARDHVVAHLDWSVVEPRFREILLGPVSQMAPVRRGASQVMRDVGAGH